MPVVVDGLANVRGLGGLARADGSRTPDGVFLRAERLDRVTPSGWEVLRDWGVRTVIDLRRPAERTGAVPGDLVRLDVDLDGDERSYWEPVEADGTWGTPLYFESHLQCLPHRMAAVLRAVAGADEGAVLFHCGAGWDRTGLLAALLLRAADVTVEDAAADYLTSYTTSGAVAALHGGSSGVEPRRRVLAAFGHTAESAFRATYARLDLGRWFDHAGIERHVRHEVMTWRGALASP